MIAVLAVLGAALRPGPGSPGGVTAGASDPAAPRTRAPIGTPAGATSPTPAGATSPTPAGAPSPTPDGTPAGATSPTPNGTPDGTPAGASDPGTARSLDELLDLLPVRPEVRRGYDRSLFELWIDADGDGCNTRREVLIEEAVVAPAVAGRCQLTGGRWRSLYDGIETTDSGTFDIDHVVPLAEAWDSGAFAWTPDQRTAFANDLGVPWSLIAVSATSNRAKSDGDPADWMPPLASVRCLYVADWLAIKVRWSLALDRRERDFLGPIARACPDRMPVVPAP